MPLPDDGTNVGPVAPTPSYDCVIPAAGYSSRMDALKQLVSFRGRPLLVSAIANAAAVCDRIILVTGYLGERVQETIEKDSLFRRLGSTNSADRSVEIVVVANDEYDLGMISSIACGASHVTSRWFFVAPGDMPIIDPAVYRSLSAAIPTVPPDTRAIFPVWNEGRGHPVLIDRRVVPNLLAEYREAESMRSFLQRYSVHHIEIASAALGKGIFVDIDTPEDLARVEAE